MKLLIVGGVAGGASAAARARRLSEDADIVLFEAGPDVSFANCGLPYYIGGEITERDKLLVVTPERMQARFNLDVRDRSSVEAIDRAARKFRIRDLASGRRVRGILRQADPGPGAAPLRPPIPGIDLPGIFTLRNLEDADHIKAAVRPGRAAGGRGRRRLHRAGAGRKPRAPRDRHHARRAARPGPAAARQGDDHPHCQAWRAKGVTLLLGQSAEAFEPDVRRARGALEVRRAARGATGRVGRRRAAGEQAGGRCRAGSRPPRRHPRQRVLQTSDPDIFAVGDAIEVVDFVSGEPTQVPLAGPANRQGRIAADNIFGRAVRYRGTQGTAIVGVFDRTAAITGASEKTLQRASGPPQDLYPSRPTMPATIPAPRR